MESKEQGNQAEEYNKILKIVHDNLGDDFYKTGSIHSKISDAMESYASLRVSEAVEIKDKVIKGLKDLIENKHLLIEEHVESLEAKDKEIAELKASLSSSERFRAHDAMSAINENNQLRAQLEQSKKDNPALNIEELKKLCTDFFFHWYNAKGNNTYQGCEDWFKTDHAKEILSKIAVSGAVSVSTEKEDKYKIKLVDVLCEYQQFGMLSDKTLIELIDIEDSLKD